MKLILITLLLTFFVHANSEELFCDLNFSFNNTLSKLLENEEYSKVDLYLSYYVKKMEAHNIKLYDEGFSKKYRAGTAYDDMASTPIDELVFLNENFDFKPGAKLIDVGSGYGKPSLILGALNPKIKVMGYEVNPVRVKWTQQAAKDLKQNNVTFIEQDLSENRFNLPYAEYYYFF